MLGTIENIRNDVKLKFVHFSTIRYSRLKSLKVNWGENVDVPIDFCQALKASCFKFKIIDIINSTYICLPFVNLVTEIMCCLM